MNLGYFLCGIVESGLKCSLVASADVHFSPEWAGAIAVRWDAADTAQVADNWLDVSFAVNEGAGTESVGHFDQRGESRRPILLLVGCAISIALLLAAGTRGVELGHNPVLGSNSL